MLNTTHRQVVWELLNSTMVQQVHLEHQLYRIAHYYRDGLTEKEYKFLMQRVRTLREEGDKMVKLKDRLKGTVHGRSK